MLCSLKAVSCVFQIPLRLSNLSFILSSNSRIRSKTSCALFSCLWGIISIPPSSYIPVTFVGKGSYALVRWDFFVDTNQLVLFAMTAGGPSLVALGFPRSTLIAGLHHNMSAIIRRYKDRHLLVAHEPPCADGLHTPGLNNNLDHTGPVCQEVSTAQMG